MTQLMFETFSVPQFQIANQAVLSLFATGRASGIVVESGASATSIVPVDDGNRVSSAILHSSITGRDLTTYLLGMLTKVDKVFEADDLKEPCSSNAKKRTIAQDIKQKLCFVAADFAATAKSTDIEKQYQLPDGKNLLLSNVLYQCPEPLFQPHLLGKQELGIHKLLCSSIEKCDPYICKVLYDNVVLGGGNTMFRGLDERLKNEVVSLASPNTLIKIVAATDRQFSAWKGASILCCLSIFNDMWILSKEYTDIGSSIIHRKRT
ncbi:actin, cytoplasmic 2-like isoform 1 [Reticulomyxa filosa]|uniref:Actin, cytoplasmic 2-like isoform 1 n=1 Tax=Reticulomyxa filosa TaxID=46433 RepID=X6N630_RETFI|nr:actin, cytoplasmic 2-like isoform 1 [Reticulomyxa filosa]|eukprot:ETO21219.1 actin, cytoplasmic 2-like isoform 1 [Reticulomyxa filosa]